jgi:hypothetical protein
MSIIQAALKARPDTTQLALEYNCLSTAAPGDLVCHDELNDRAVISVSTNTSINKVFGIILDKPTSVTAKVLLIGRLSGFTGLTLAGTVWLSALGDLTQTRPTTGYLHAMGEAESATEILFNPAKSRVLLS